MGDWACLSCAPHSFLRPFILSSKWIKVKSFYCNATGQRNSAPTESWILEKVLKFAQQFSRPGKSLENWDKVLKNGTKSRVFFESYNKCFIGNFFCFAHHEKSFVPAFSQGLHWSPIWWPWVWKIIVLGKVWKQSWILDLKICTNPVKIMY